MELGNRRSMQFAARERLFSWLGIEIESAVRGTAV